MKNIDVCRTALVLINHHGLKAVNVALDRGDLLLNQGDIEGGKIWARIAETTERLLSRNPVADESVN